MITYKHGGRMIERLEELPALPDHIDTLYGDFETTSHDPNKDALNPWFHCDILGIAFTFDDAPGSWYLPVNHLYGTNLPKDAVIDYWRELLKRSRAWCNHNVKYDCHVSTNACGVDPLAYGLQLECTVVLSKLVNSDRLMYRLDKLAHDWLDRDIGRYDEAIQSYLQVSRNRKIKDYGHVPADVMAEYACEDVLTNRLLKQYLLRKRHPECQRVWDLELSVTPMLIEMERVGLHVDPTELKIDQLKSMTELLNIEEALYKETGRYIRPHVNEDCFDVLCNHYGLPVLGYTDSGNPSFDKATMMKYSVHPQAPTHIIKLMQRYRKLNTHVSLFLIPYQELNVNGVMHPSVNQVLRTGRMSASKPNAQQLNSGAKALIHPPPGHSIISIDYSQIEFRLIVHYINNAYAVKAYNDDPYTDFHQWVADMIPMPRRPAKNVNFMMGYGGGKKKMLAMLIANKEAVGDVIKRVDALVESGEVPEAHRDWMFQQMATQRANDIFARYHNALPELKPTSRAAEIACRHKGYVRTLYGRHRHLPEKRAHTAFNTANQGSAADLMKDRAVAVHDACRGTPVKLVELVHDEFVFIAPTDTLDDPRTVSDLIGVLESPDVQLRVPIRTSAGWSNQNWSAAGKPELKIAATSGRLAHLK